MENLPYLSILIFLPILGAAALFFMVRGDDEVAQKNTRQTALLTTFATFLFSLFVYSQFDQTALGYQFVEKIEWVKGYAVSYHLGVDGLSLSMILLTTLLMPICVLASWKNSVRLKEYMISFLLLEGIVIGVFCALDMVLFYLFFEAVLIPMFLIIGIWGGDNRIYAAFKFFLYTLIGSVLFLIAMLYMYNIGGTTSIVMLTEVIPNLSLDIEKWLWLGLFASFAVKVPMFPFHTWLPDAHVQAPTAGSVILAGVLLKLGGYGFLRFSLPMLPEASLYFQDLVIVLSIIAIIYTSMVAFVQTDMKKLIAYSSVAHMGFVTLAIFTFNEQGLDAAIFQMISHGVVSAALFLCVGVVYDRMHTREIAKFGGLTSIMPRYALLFMLFTMASVGLPTTSGFVGEFITFMAVWKVDYLATALAATGVVVGAAYMLVLYRNVMFGELKEACKDMTDVNGRELLCLVPLAALAIYFGVYPNVIFELIDVPVNRILEQVAR